MNKILNYIRSSIGLRAVIVWSIVFIIMFIQLLWINVELSLTMALVTVTSIIIVYYVTQAILIPKLLIKEKKVVYIILSILMIISLAYVCSRLEIYIFMYFDIAPKHELKFVFSVSRFLTLFSMAYAISNIIFFSKKTAEDAKLKEELLSEKKMLEVRVLKSQINSHFIFNALNNIYSMTYFKDEYTSGYVLKLAQMMRYVMEDCETELTPLYKDIEYIENFIDFQKLRFENDKDISFSYDIGDNKSIAIPPMIFQPLVENCFKYTPLEVDKNSFIYISLKVKDNKIHFIAKNSQPLIKNKPAGNTRIGIENIKRRLDLYYGTKYALNISDDADFYQVELCIDL